MTAKVVPGEMPTRGRASTGGAGASLVASIAAAVNAVGCRTDAIEFF
jgi:hypothetical protein